MVGKSIFDPSPLGWRVPINNKIWSEVFNNAVTFPFTSTETYAGRTYLSGKVNAYYPISGFRIKNSGQPSLVGGGQETISASVEPDSPDYVQYIGSDTTVGIAFTGIRTRSEGCPVRAIQE